MRFEVRNPFEFPIRRAVELSRQPGMKSRESGAGRGGFATHENITTTTDGDGNTIHPFVLDLDALDDLNAVLI